MVQWCLGGWLSLGIHIDFKTRYTGIPPVAYGPYVDLHLIVAILSLGRNPRYSGDIQTNCSVSRGGIRAT